ncbi:DUF6155 family protein [Joostella sp. CR20]|uniref:DUF6155 family protein n=1 Tax=Joostella sp. CR20 TaxID=2804312 RepID=UPI00313CEE43
MSKRDLKKYLTSLEKEELEAQILDLYTRFKNVKEFYDFVFNPKEDKLVEVAKTKIANEYFPINRRKPKARRSIAQKHIKHFIELGVNPVLTADVMWFTIEIAQTFNQEKAVKSEAFYKSMAKSFEEAVKFSIQHQLLTDYKTRIVAIYQEAKAQKWSSLPIMETALDMVD